jgi:hypothetical protein
MKIEVGESLIFSWLRHVQGCPIVQTSWKPSPAWPVRTEAALASEFETMRKIAEERLGFEVFKKSSFQQFIRQAEIDVLGLRFSDAGRQPSVSTQRSTKMACSMATSRRQLAASSRR